MAIIIIRTLVVYFALVVSMRFMGKRQLSELELPELAIAVLIADLAAHPLQDIGIPLMNGCCPSWCSPAASSSSQGAALRHAGLRTLLFGRPCFLIRRGKIDQKEMKRCPAQPRGALRRAARPEHYRHLAGGVRRAGDRRDDVRDTLSRVPTGDGAGPGAQARDTGYPVIIINDGKLMRDNLRIAGRDEVWLRQELKRRAPPGRATYIC